ncbi:MULTISPECIES: OmpP1/FadL family transporter [Thalassospira]|uniref:Long-chain fatty acid transporter n=2 Tax=Thalassospira tepidiphila TaxID=393657 RepID=A0A853L2I5_9PROT|nr:MULTISPECIES: OmpP1/FadL family transporter [Thalassospira]KZD02362.1 long-chain fatty acid transporter [Thalassospira sp. MCCC 1A02898]MBE71288.1 transporter [Thalassospira sp.]MBO6579846.1 outer membrane protein transport protein [Thalassospira sp.]MBO6801674.1 outer membrane protein transport protein [Thalassospira sp.]MBO6817732.1 outer membrane protein transport protein [Thalassospira sp.]|tara:strand:- start:1192 stop:2502 length:1311 start_codon:yes stop_codon:yes gene_type:complete
MSYFKKSCLWGAASGTALLCALASVGTAQASGFQVRETSGTLQGSSFAGMTTLSTDASTMSYNPGTVGQYKETSYSAGITVIRPVAKATNTVATNGARTVIAQTGGGYKDMAQDAAVPNAHAVWKLNDQINLGVSITAPWGLVTDNDSDFAGRFFGTTSKIKTVNIKPVVAYRFDNGLSIGAGPQVQRFEAALSKAVPSLGGAVAEGNSTIEGDDIGYGWTAGMNWEVTKTTRVGLSYISEVEHKLKGDITFDNAAKNLATPYTDRDANAKITTPESIAFGISHDLSDKWTVMGDVQWTNWNSVGDLVFNYSGLINSASTATGSTTENYQWGTSWFGALGARYQYDEKWSFTGGVAYDETPIQTRNRNVRLPDSDRYWVSFGATYKAADWADVTLGYTHIFADEARVDHASSLVGNYAADYEAKVDIIALQANFKF